MMRPSLVVYLGCLSTTLLLGVCACSANPGPPPVVGEAEAALIESSAAAPTTTEISASNRSQVSMGVDPLTSGLNPHLYANNFELVEQVADVTLPSAFHNGIMDSDLLKEAVEVAAPEGVAQRIKYTLSSAAQWSDGAPISGADFIYLWRNAAQTPGVKNAAGYKAISNITTAQGGREVLVDFSTRVEQWPLLFDHLLPSHLLSTVPFSVALSDGIPASAGRYVVESVDRARGMITLHRNDRYWGNDPARTDIVRLRTVRSVELGASMLRSGQIGFADITPQQTGAEALSLVKDVSTESLNTARQLRLSLLNTESGVRKELAGVVDTAQVARISTGRSEALSIPYGANPLALTEVSGAQDLPALRALNRPVKLAADPTDPVASAAAQVIADQLTARGIAVDILQEKIAVVQDTLMKEGSVDALVSWKEVGLNPIMLADNLDCSGSEEQPDWCSGQTEQLSKDALSGAVAPKAVEDAVRELNFQQALYVPILDETRLHALGRGITGPGMDVAAWRSGLRSVATWESEN